MPSFQSAGMWPVLQTFVKIACCALEELWWNTVGACGSTVTKLADCGDGFVERWRVYWSVSVPRSGVRFRIQIVAPSTRWVVECGCEVFTPTVQGLLWGGTWRSISFVDEWHGLCGFVACKHLNGFECWAQMVGLDPLFHSLDCACYESLVVLFGPDLKGSL